MGVDVWQIGDIPRGLDQPVQTIWADGGSIVRTVSNPRAPVMVVRVRVRIRVRVRVSVRVRVGIRVRVRVRATHS